MNKEKHDCVGRICTGFRYVACNLPANREHNGQWYCHMHDPEAIAVKDKKRQDKWAEESRARDSRREFEKREADFSQACISAIRAIAGGHNDASGLARRVLREHGE